jgi:hypothetical protein
MTVSGRPVAFRGSHAIAAGLVTRGRLRGRRFRRLLPDVYCRASGKPPDLLLRSLAAYRLVEGRGVLSGYSAALVLDAACTPRSDVPAEVTVAGDVSKASRTPNPHESCATSPATPGWVDLGWQVYRYTKREVYGYRARIVADLTRARARST